MKTKPVIESTGKATQPSAPRTRRSGGGGRSKGERRALPSSQRPQVTSAIPRKRTAVTQRFGSPSEKMPISDGGRSIRVAGGDSTLRSPGAVGARVRDAAPSIRVVRRAAMGPKASPPPSSAVASPPLLPCDRDLLTTRFAIGDPIGRSEAGVTLRCLDKESGDDCVIKVFSEVWSKSDAERMRALVDVSARQDAVARVREVERLPSGRLYQVRDLYFGEDLGTWAKGKTAKQLIAMLARCEMALLDLHRAGLVHGRMSERNVLVQEVDGTARLRLLDVVGRANDRAEHDLEALSSMTRRLLRLARKRKRRSSLGARQSQRRRREQIRGVDPAQPLSAHRFRVDRATLIKTAPYWCLGIVAALSVLVATLFGF